MDHSFADFGCYLIPVVSYLEDIVKSFDYYGREEIDLGTANFVLEEAHDFRILAMNWECLGAIPEALENYAHYIGRLLFVLEKGELNYFDYKIISSYDVQDFEFFNTNTIVVELK